nr:hypothetical protein Q903MT_gene3560 [Picea sitchensis]
MDHSFSTSSVQPSFRSTAPVSIYFPPSIGKTSNQINDENQGLWLTGLGTLDTLLWNGSHLVDPNQ